MAEFVFQIAVVLGVLATCFIGPAIALFLLIARKKQARKKRRSPIAKDLLRSPGYSLREELEEIGIDLTFDSVMLMVVPLLILSLFLAQGYVIGLPKTVSLAPLYVVIVLGYIGYTLYKLLKMGKHLDNVKAGFDAELAVGQELDQLMRQGAIVFHDFPAEKFNIDHIVIAPEGIFAVETKGFTKDNEAKGRANATVTFDGHLLKFPAWTTREPIEQAERQAQWLANWITSAVGSAVHVLPVIALPGWFVERTGRGNVRVFNGKELAGLLKSRGTQVLSAEDLRRIAHQVDQRCRTVAPTYAEQRKAR